MAAAIVISRVLGRAALLWSAVVFSGQSAAARPPEWVTRAIRAPRVTQGLFESKAARSRVSYHIYLPETYGRTPQRRFPVVYWLHGSGGGLPGIEPVARHFDQAIGAGRVPPCLVVFVNGLKHGMYVDWKDGSAPVESLIVRELLPHIDASYRTIATREGRLLDGYSMGGYGAARLGFKFPELFAAVSMMGAGPLQPNLTADAPRATKRRAQSVLQDAYGGDSAYFFEVSPRTLAARNARVIARSVRVRMVIGTLDETYANNVAFHEHLKQLAIPHDWIALNGVGHDPMRTMLALGDRHWEFYRAAFGR
jgi:enterochelin esterase-like enzyme